MASNVQYLQKYVIIFRCINVFITVAFVSKRRVNKSLSFFLIYFRYVDVVLMRCCSHADVALMLFSATDDDIFPFFCRPLIVQFANHSAWRDSNLVVEV